MLAHENPFRSERIESLAFRPQGDSWPEIMDRLRAMRYRGAIVGPKGSGKTTMLEELKGRLENEGWKIEMLRLTEEQNSIPWNAIENLARDASPQTMVMLDGADQLGTLAWMRFRWRVRRAGGLVIAVHAVGRMKTVHEAKTSPELLGELIEELHAQGSFPEECERLFRNHSGNCREAFFALFKDCIDA